MSNTPIRFTSFTEFYPFYLGEHRHPTCRALHFIGSSLGLVFLVAAILQRSPWQ